MGTLRQEELDFLRHHGFSEIDILDARNETSDIAKLKAKSMGKSFYLGNPCRNFGHRIKTRGGHCAICRPENIAYAKRHSEGGILYVAASRHGKVFKVGSTDNRENRERQLRSRAYGGLTDWEVICAATVKRKGEAEIVVARILAGHQAHGTYKNGELDQSASEMYHVGLRTVLNAFTEAVTSSHGANFWKHPRLKSFEKL